MKKLYIGNLPFATTDEDLRQFFSQYGDVVSASVIRDRMTGRSRGFGFVEMEDDQADKAVDQANGQQMDGRALVVNEARPLQERSPHRGRDEE